MTNFKKIVIKGLDKDETIDMSKAIGNYLYYNSRDLAGSELGKKIYFSEGDITLTEDEKQIIAQAIEQTTMPYIQKAGVMEAMK